MTYDMNYENADDENRKPTALRSSDRVGEAVGEHVVGHGHAAVLQVAVVVVGVGLLLARRHAVHALVRLGVGPRVHALTRGRGLEQGRS